MRAFNKNTGRPIVGYKETCYYSIDPLADSFSWTDDDPELCCPIHGGEIFKSDEIIYWDDEGNECERWDLDLVDFEALRARSLAPAALAAEAAERAERHARCRARREARARAK